MYCLRCGEEIGDDSEFCIQCAEEVVLDRSVWMNRFPGRVRKTSPVAGPADVKNPFRVN